MDDANRVNTTILDHRRRVLRAMIYMDKHLDRRCRLEHVADVACLSPFHFHRLFTRYTGETPNRHFLRRRLERAARRLSEASDRVIDIALEAGYESHHAFSKAFRQWAGISPSRFRDSNRHLSGFNAFLPAAAKRSQNGPGHRPWVGRIDPLPLAYVERRGFSNGSLVEAGMTAGLEVAAILDRMGLSHRVRGWVSTFPQRPTGCMDVDARIQSGAIVTPPTDMAPPLKWATVGGGRWIVFCHRGPYEFLFQTWNAAYFNWLPVLGLRPRNTPPFEWYADGLTNTAPEKRRTFIHIPIV
ncbi:MAG: AraC family transcriptional regulator [Desulfobacterales bacterium]|nr:AraC family transcriptional regulator [Desulfobacterales bacterium]